MKFFIKTKIQSQVEEYVAWKEARGVVMWSIGADLLKFIKHTQKDTIEDIRLEDLRNYYNHLQATENSKYFIHDTLKNIRVMFRWFKARKYNVIEPDIITEEGLTIDLENAIIGDMMTAEAKKLGRPPKIALINKVKSLRDINKLSFREIARVVRKDVSQVHVWYYYDLTKV